MKARRVLVQLNSLSLGGTQLNALDLALAVREYGFHSELYGPRDTLPDAGASLLDVAAERDAIVHTYDRSRGVLTGGAAALEARAQRMGAEIVHVYGAAGEPRQAFWGPCRWGRRPFVHTVYEMAVDRDVYRHTSLIVGTKYLEEELVDRPGPTALISPPVDVVADAPSEELAAAFRSTLGVVADRTLIVIVSRLERAMKAAPVEVAIDAMRMLAGEGATLVIVGGGSEAERLEALGERVNADAAERLVTFVGPLADPRGAYAAADVVLGMGGSAARALAFGRTLVVQGEYGTSELFEPSRAQDLFRRSFWSDASAPEGTKRLASLLTAVLGSERRRQHLGDFGRRFAIHNFSLDAMAARLADVYTSAPEHSGIRAWARDLPREAPYLGASVRRRLPKGRARGRGVPA